MLDPKYLLPFEKPIADLYRKVDELKKLAKTGDLDMNEEVRSMEGRIEYLKREIFSNLTPSQIVLISRHIMRPTSTDYISMIFDDFVELHGDRLYGDDPAMVGGFAKLNGRHVMVIGHQKGSNTKENISRNFGMAHPEGYRKALRLMNMAEKFNRPIITLIDTPGAYCGIGAEERGQAEAIARNLREMAMLRVPFIAVITGEGGSGGALGIGVGNKVLMFEYSQYSVISPEGCAAILWHDAKKAPDAAENLKITAKDLLEMKIVDEVIKEPLGGAHNDPRTAADSLKAALERHLLELLKLSPDDILNNRYEKFRKMGWFEEAH